MDNTVYIRQPSKLYERQESTNGRGDSMIHRDIECGLNNETEITNSSSRMKCEEVES
jgi:hypothetical protein